MSPKWSLLSLSSRCENSTFFSTALAKAPIYLVTFWSNLPNLGCGILLSVDLSVDGTVSPPALHSWVGWRERDFILPWVCTRACFLQILICFAFFFSNLSKYSLRNAVASRAMRCTGAWWSLWTGPGCVLLVTELTFPVAALPLSRGTTRSQGSLPSRWWPKERPLAEHHWYLCVWILFSPQIMDHAWILDINLLLVSPITKKFCRYVPDLLIAL